MRKKRFIHSAGFTLIELSIVVVIIGLIVAGVVGGQKLIEQAKLRSVITEMDQYKTAFTSFYLKYDAIPGDMVNAQDYWGGTVANGDGNAQISADEGLYGWEHLAISKIIAGSFTGEKDGSSWKAVGKNIPGSPWSSDAGYAMKYSVNVGGL